MDIQRLEKLAALAGLSLEGTDRPRLLGEISALEDMAASLPEVDPEPNRQPPATKPLLRRETAPLDRARLKAGAPATDGGFFLVPGVPHRGSESD